MKDPRLPSDTLTILRGLIKDAEPKQIGKAEEEIDAVLQSARPDLDKKISALKQSLADFRRDAPSDRHREFIDLILEYAEKRIRELQPGD